MQVFEFHFNPKIKEGVIFESFCYEPSNVYEKRLGSLYMAGLLKNALPQNTRFLNNLAKTIKDTHYKNASLAPERALRDSLRKTNEFLENIAKEGDVSWLGNLDFSVLSIKNFELNFTKVGDVKIFLIRRGRIIDIDQKLKFEEIEPYPLKIFGNIVSGKLAEEDVILILTKEALKAFLEEKILEKIALISPFEPKSLREILKVKQEQISKISGLCLILALTRENSLPRKETLGEKKKLQVFSLKKIFAPLFKFRIPKPSLKLKKPSFKLKFPAFKLKLPSLKFKLPSFKLKIPSLQKPKVSKIKLNVKKTKTIKKPERHFNLPKINLPHILSDKKSRLILGLIFFLIIGFFLFTNTDQKQIRGYEAQLNQIQDKASEGETYLLLSKTNPKAGEKSKELLTEAWDEISSLEKTASSLSDNLSNKIVSLKTKISSYLEQLNGLENLNGLEPIFEFKAQEYVPQKIVSLNGDLYFFSPYSANVFQVDKNGEGKIFSTEDKFSLAVAFSDSIVFFAKPNKIMILKDSAFLPAITLRFPYEDFSPQSLSSFQGNLYFLDNQKGIITKYPYFGSYLWGQPQTWYDKAADFKSIAASGSILALTKDNSIEKYYAGNLQEKITIDTFPYPKDFSKIFTSSRLPYIYLLEPIQKRIVVIDASGKTIKQFESEEFDNLLSFAVSENGGTIYLLNGMKAYKISLNY